MGRGRPRAARRALFVFHRRGERITSFRRAWTRACERAGLEVRLVHDLRRSAARDFRRQGVSEGEIMKLCGWKTRAMFDRYNIIDEADLAQAVAKRFNGKTTANTATPTATPSPLSSSPGDKFFQGALDDIRIYNRVLSTDEIQLLWQEQ